MKERLRFRRSVHCQQRRDYAALRSLTGVALTNKCAGKSCIVVRMRPRLPNIPSIWADRLGHRFPGRSQCD